MYTANTQNFPDLSDSSGVTLVELLVAVAIFSVVMAGIWTNFISQKNIYHSQQQVAMIQQNIRSAMFLMEKQLRMAGYNPLSRPGYGITDIKNNSVAFNYYDETTGKPTVIRYYLSGSDLLRELIVDGNPEPPEILAENIYNSGGNPGFAIAYAFDADSDGALDTVGGSPNGEIIWAIDSNADNRLDARLDGTALANSVPVQDIRSVKVWLLAQGDRPDPKYNENKIYAVGTNDITTDDRIRRRIMSTIIKCRNLGR